MKSNPFSEDKIEQYLLGKLSAKERLEMEQAFREQPELAMELELKRLEFDTAEELIAQDIGTQFQRLQEKEENGNWIQILKRRWYWLAAGVVLLLSFFLLYRYSANSTDPPREAIPIPVDTVRVPINTPFANADTIRVKLPPENQLPKQNGASNRRALAVNFYRKSEWGNLGNLRGTDAQNPINTAMKDFERGAFQESLQALASIGKNDPQYERAQMIKAHAYFRLNDFTNATACASHVVDFGKAPLLENAQWLYVLSLAADGKIQSEKFQVASEIILKDEGHPFYNEMAALRDSIPR